MELTWLGQGGFLLVEAGFRLAVDPYFSSRVEELEQLTRLLPPPLTASELRPDLLICTHDHLDHYDEPLVLELLTRFPGCRLAGPRSVERKFRAVRPDVAAFLRLDSGAAATFGPFRVRAVAAYHSDPAAIGLVIAVAGRVVYLTGDTLWREELATAVPRNVDLLLVCINGKLGNMNDREALALAAALRPRLAVPMHYGLFAENTADPDRFLKGCAAQGIAARTLTPGVAVPLFEETQGSR